MQFLVSFLFQSLLQTFEERLAGFFFKRSLCMLADVKKENYLKVSLTLINWNESKLKDEDNVRIGRKVCVTNSLF